MAFFMLLHEKMRLQRKVNKLTYKQLRASNKKERITKNIERLQKYYSKKSDNLQKQAQIMQSQASVFFNNMMGVGAQNQMFNPFCYQSGSAGMTTAAAQIMSGWASSIKEPLKYKYNDNGEYELKVDTSFDRYGSKEITTKTYSGKVYDIKKTEENGMCIVKLAPRELIEFTEIPEEVFEYKEEGSASTGLGALLAGLKL